MNRERLAAVKNEQLRAHAETYVEIYEEFLEAVKGYGLDFDPVSCEAEVAARRQSLRAKGAIFRNNDHSIYTGRISPACEACQKGVGSLTFYVSLKCHRKCFYCFNHNQEDYQLHTETKRDVVAEVDEFAATGLGLSHVALTGGEPLLYPQETMDFFAAAGQRFPGVHTRLYTSGDQIDREMLSRLKESGLQEIRFSVRAHDGEKGRRHTYERIALAREYIPQVMVEMPVLPGTQEIMKEVLRELDRLGVFGINLLEFCYPLFNADEYQARGYQVKQQPYATLYDYWYAGGLPVSRSELECLELMEWALDEGLCIGIHYCSLENKHTGQIFQQNYGQKLSPVVHFSERDYFYKTAKVFGKDVMPVYKALSKAGRGGYVVSEGFIEFNPLFIGRLKDLDVEVGICTQVAEQREDGLVLRELKVGVTTPRTFEPDRDL
ncbi:MAG: radical family protein [Symbiobacteriaceae bacterium]|jgi:pyruvate formate-lyase activating enzyme-like uncharacterized protein|nr:radical family protein [Symbiobacteriaceae bacterium]